MTSDDIFNFVRSLIVGFSEVEEGDIHMDTEISTLGVDSLDLVEMQVEFQKRLGVKLSSSVFASGEVKTIADLVAHVEGLVVAAA